MTLGIGLQCQEGVVLVTDSLQEGRAPGRRPDYWLDGAKLQWLVGTETAVVISGYVDDGELAANGISANYAPLATWLPREENPYDRVRRAYSRLRQLDAKVRSRLQDDLYHELDDPGPHALFAVGEPGHQPSLAKFTTKTQTWAELGDVFVIGGWLLGVPPGLADEFRRPAPDTLADCRALAADWVRRFMDTVFGYRDAFAMASETGKMPCIGFPLQILTVTDESHHQREVLAA